VQEALLQLPYEFREAVVMCDVVGLTYQEIADAAEVPVGTVRSRIHRGRLMLRDALEGR
jgi:RNA polymerase sigma-70 factor (ECF subfamily)